MFIELLVYISDDCCANRETEYLAQNVCFEMKTSGPRSAEEVHRRTQR